ncbi:hypothetical protein [Roseovarius sp. E0-M6]|uniref:hypothetical protein n=1 Tax=Roseovarius sp. E0-M6 TaxID=3127118 RepID=UPI0030101EB8
MAQDFQRKRGQSFFQPEIFARLPGKSAKPGAKMPGGGRPASVFNFDFDQVYFLISPDLSREL